MNHTSTNQEISKTIMALMSALDGCVIERNDWNPDTLQFEHCQTIKPLFKYGIKPRQLHELVTPAGTNHYPYIAVVMNSISIDSARNTNKCSDIFDMNYVGEDGITYYRKPTPITLDISVHLGSKTLGDWEAMVSHYLSVINPNIFISWREPVTGKEIRSKVKFGGSVPLSFTRELQAGEDDEFTSELSFTVETWVFRDTTNKQFPISKVALTYGVVEDYSCENYFDLSDVVDYHETSTMTNDVEIWKIIPECVSYGDKVYIEGQNLSEIQGLYLTNLSGDVIPTSEYEPFCFSESLSSQCPLFEGMLLDKYEVYSDGLISFDIPDSLSGVSGNYDILVTNKWTGCSVVDKQKRTKLNNVNLVLSE